jgi:hypothetical protein
MARQMMNPLAKELDGNGLVLLPDLVPPEQLKQMQRAFDARLRRMRWNNFDGYEKTERYRHMVEDVLTLDPGFLRVALHSVVKQILAEYLGDRFELVEAKGWESVPTRRDFHGWHGDAWYKQEYMQAIPREVKLGIYLTDVETGAFNYIKGSHRKQHPRTFRNSELQQVPKPMIVEVTGAAGLAFLFDTSGIHRQGVPILERRRVVFYDYHDPDVPLQREDVESYRYHPLLLNAAFLTDLDRRDERILGFGNIRNFVCAFEQQERHDLLQVMFSRLYEATLWQNDFRERIRARLKRYLRLE